jgi:nucleoside-diphosphate-sugar epimerase
MRIAITGGGGFLGGRLAGQLLANGHVKSLLVADVGVAAPSRDPRVSFLGADLTEPGAARAAVDGADVVFHLAAVVSGQAEADFDLGMRVNVDGTRSLLEAARAGGRRPKFVFASSLAVFGPPLPEVITDDTAVRPRSSYGAQKAIGELLVSDYSRKGFVDGRVTRLPTVCVRPGRPNAAASSFVSGIIREPLNGLESVCPVDASLELWLSSPRAAVANLAHAAWLPAASLGERRVVNLPGITVTVREMIAVLGRLGGREAAGRVRFAQDPAVDRIVSSWPSRFDVSRAIGLGFVRDPGFESLVRDFIADNAAEETGR